MRQISYSTEIHAPFDTVWRLLAEHIEQCSSFPPGTGNAAILERHDNVVVRELRGEGLIIRERVTMDRQKGEIRFDLLEHPLFSGYVIQRAIPRAVQSPTAPVQLTMIVYWVPKSEDAEKTIMENLPSSLQVEVLSLKETAEEAARE